MRQSTTFLFSVIFLFILSASTCQRYVRKEMKTLDEVGSVRVSVVAVAPWAEYKEALQPQFKLKPEQALALVAPTTRMAEQRTLDAVKTVLRASLPTETTVETVKSIVGEGTTEDSSERVTTRSPGSLDTAPVPESAAGTRTADSLTGIARPEGIGLDELDPKLRYKAATALYQEVSLLDRYIKDVAQREEYEPYIVRLQLGVMPRRRGLEYDAYVDLSFFQDDEAQEQNIVQGSSSGSDKCKGEDDQQGSTNPPGDVAEGSKQFSIPIVLPIIATDSLETSLDSVIKARIRDLGASLSALAQTAVSAEFSKLSEKLDSALGRDINSTFTVGSLSDNTIRVRIGAFQQVNQEFAMIPRTESVTVLLLVHKDYVTSQERLIHIYVENEMRHASTGTALKPKPQKVDEREVDEIVALFEIDLEKININNLWNHVLEHDWGGYRKELKRQDDVFMYKEQLWLELARLQPTYGIDIVAFQLPKKEPLRIFPAQTVLLHDDGKASTTAILRQGSGLDATHLCAALQLLDTNEGIKHKFVADTTAIALDQGGQTARISFPFSLKDYGLDSYVREGRAMVSIGYSKNSEKCWQSAMSNRNSQDGCSTDPISADKHCAFTSRSVLYTLKGAKAQKAVGFTLTPITESIATDASGRGSLEIVLTTEKIKVGSQAILTINGAHLLEASEAGQQGISHVGNEVKINLPEAGKKTQVRLKLDGLIQGKKVKVSSKNEKKVRGAEIEWNIDKPHKSS